MEGGAKDEAIGQRRNRRTMFFLVAVVSALIVGALVFVFLVTLDEDTPNEKRDLDIPNISDSNKATEAPTENIAARPTLSPTANATEVERKYLAFTNRQELVTAVDAYYAEPESNETLVAEVYGWPIATWNVSQVANFTYVFKDKSLFDESLHGWDMSGAKTVEGMFYRAFLFTGKGLEHWDVSQVEVFDNMFLWTAISDLNLASWDVSSAKSMASMFQQCDEFLGLGLPKWNVSSGEWTCSCMVLVCKS